MASDEIDLDDFDLEDFDLEIPEFDAEPEQDDRKPTTKLASGFYTGVKETLTSGNTVERAIKLSLPEGYSMALNAKDTVIDSVKELYNSAAVDLAPVTVAVGKSVGKISPKVKEKLPKFIQRKLDDLEYSANSGPASFKKEGQEQEIAAAIQDVFRTQIEIGHEQAEEQRAETLVRTTIESKQRNSLIENTNVVARGMDRLVSYQDSILSKFHQKSLELQFRHYFVAKDLLDSNNLQNDKIISALDSVVKNTALPEAVKIQRSEQFGLQLKERLNNSAMDGIAAYTREYRQKLMGNAKGFLGGITGTIGGMAGMAGGMGGMGDGTTNAGQVAGRLLADEAIDFASNKINPLINRNEKVRRGGLQLTRTFTDIPQQLMRWAGSETKGTGYGSFLTQLIKDNLPTFYANDKVGENPLMASDKPAVYDQLARRSIIEVIPTYLSQIAHWTKAAATGEIDNDMQVYSIERAGMTTKKNQLNDIKRRVMPRHENVSVKGEIDAYINSLDKDKTLSDKARKALRRQLLIDVTNGGFFDPREYSKFEAFGRSNADEDTIDELAGFFRDQFGVNTDGEIEDKSIENEERMTKAMTDFSRLKQVAPNPDGKIRALVDVVGRDALRELGLIKRVNRDDRIDMEKLIDMILDEKEIASGEKSFESQFTEKDESEFEGETITEKAQRKLREALEKKKKEDIRYADEDDDLADQTPKARSATGALTSLSEIGRSAPQVTVSGVQASLDTTALDEYLGKDSEMLLELVRIRETVSSLRMQSDNREELGMLQHQAMVLETIRDILQSTVIGGEGGAVPAAAGSRFSLGGNRFLRGIGNMAKGAGQSGLSAAGAVGRFAKGYAKLSLKGYKMLGKAGWGAAKAIVPPIFRGVGGLASAVFQKRDGGDIYVFGRKVPSIRKELLETQEYFDVNSKKWIASLKDITGEVRDRAGNVIISEAEYARGLYDAKGKRLITRAAKGLGRLVAAGFTPYKLAWQGMKAVGRGLMNGFQTVRDGYLSGENKPRIIAKVMEDGGYFDQATGKVIRSYKDIKGTVVDQFGNIVVTMEELRKSGGFFTSTGERIKMTLAILGSFAAGAISGAFKMATLPFKLTAGLLRGGIAGLGRMVSGNGFSLGSLRLGGDDAKDLIQLNYVQASYQEKILNTLKTMSTGKRKKSVNGDSDGDGDRDNSWKDILARRQQKKAEKTVFGKPEEKKGGGLLGLLMTALPALIGAIGGLGATIKGAISSFLEMRTVGKLAGAIGDGLGGMDMPDGPDRGRGRGRGGKWGRVARGAGRVAGTIGRGAWAATKFIGRNVVMRGAGMLASAAAGIISAPVALTIGAVATVGYLGYKYLYNKNGHLTSVRMSQYGFNPRDKGDAAKVAQFEKALWDNTRNIDGKPSINEKKLDIKELLKLFDIDADDDSDPDAAQARLQSWGHWYRNRFLPVYTTHCSALYKLSKGTPLTDIDKSLPEHLGLEFTKAVALKDMTSVFNDKTSPFEDEELDQDADDVAEWVEKAMEYYKDKAKDLKSANDKGSVTLTSATVTSVTKSKVTVDERTTGIDNRNTMLVETAPKQQGFFTTVAKAALDIGTFGLASKVFGESMSPNFTKKRQINVAETVRVKAYGLVQLEIDKVNTLLEMEEYVYSNIEYDGSDRATWKGSVDDLFKKFVARFGVSLAEDKAAWFHWAQHRFLPVAMQYATAVKARINDNPSTASKRLKNAQLKAVLRETVEATTTVDKDQISIWEVTSAPWPGLRLNTNKASVKDNIDSIVDKDGEYDEKLSTSKAGRDTKKEKDEKEAKEKGFFGGLKDSVTSWMDKTKERISSGVEKVSNTVSDAWSATKSAASRVGGAVADAASSVGAGIRAGVGAATRAVSTAMGKVGNPSENRTALINEMKNTGITDPKEQAAFMAQMDHESGGFKTLMENLNYSAAGLLKTFRKYFRSGSEAQGFERNPEAIANRVYGGRMGNTEPDDGYQYRGRGFIQLTGKDNYIQASKALGIDLVNNPDQASEPSIAAKIASWFWKRSRAGEAAKAGDLVTSRKRINGGLNGMSDVQAKYNTYLAQALQGALVPGTAASTLDKPVAAGMSAPGAGEGTVGVMAANATTTPNAAPGAGTVGVMAMANADAAPVATSASLATPSNLMKTSFAPPESSVAETPSAPVEASAPTPAPVQRAKVAETQASAVDAKLERLMVEAASVANQQLSVQTAISTKLDKVIELMVAKGGEGQSPRPMMASANPSGPRVSQPERTEQVPMGPVSVSRNRA